MYEIAIVVVVLVLLMLVADVIVCKRIENDCKRNRPCTCEKKEEL